MTNKINVLDKGYVRLVDVMGSDLTVVNAARVSYDKESTELNEKDRRLIRFLAREGHFSPFRHASAQFEVYAPLMVARQWWKYVVGSDHVMDAWNESCLPIDEKVKAWSGKEYSIRRLLELKKLGKLPKVRSVNHVGEVVPGKIVDVFKTGTADVYEVESELGFKVRTTANHRYLTPEGYKMLDEMRPGDMVMMNGVPAYRDREWLKQHYVDKEMTQKEVAEKAGCSVHTIRKWVRAYGLQQDQVERMQNYNRIHGVFGKGLTAETSEIIADRTRKMRESSKGVPRPRPFSTPLKDNTGHWQARKTFKKEKCLFCEDKERLEIHHIDRNPRNNDPSNIEILCTKHHQMRHGRHVLMVAHPVKIKSIRKVSTEDVYDIEVSKYHNFVSNQFILHNSRRYITEEPTFYVPAADKWRSAPENSKQGSGDPVEWIVGQDLTGDLEELIEESMKLYEKALNRGVAPEQARLFLPAYGMYVRWRWTASLQSVCHFLNQRLADDAQREIAEYARAVYQLIEPRFPVSIKELV